MRGRGGGRRGRGDYSAGAVASASPMILSENEAPTGLSTPRVATPPLTEAVPLDTPRFAELTGKNTVHQTLIDTITQDLKFDHMMPVQAATLPELLPPSRNDCLAQAKTGTGKTIAFLLPAIQTMITKDRMAGDAISLLVISPTRELAMQIAKEAQGLMRRMPTYKVSLAIGGTKKDGEQKKILDGCDILVATPGRLLDHMAEEDVIHRLRALDTLVLDEADRLLDMGFLPSLKQIVANLPDKTKTKRQGMLFSATIAPHVESVANLVLSPGYKFISTIPAGELNTHEHVSQRLITVPRFMDVAPALVGAIKEELGTTREGSFKAIVFSPTAKLSDFYAHILSNIAGLPPVSVLHSRLSQSRRTATTNEYRSAKAGILVATDVIARGMDFPGVTTVFQVGIPSEKESYIHRLGRTARAGAEGRGVFIIAEVESFFPKYTLKEITFEPHPADLSAAAQVAEIAGKMDEELRAGIYRAWLGYYKVHTKPFRWDNEKLVAEANTFASDALGCPETPSIGKSTVSKMGLRGVKGLVVVPDAPRQHHNRGGGDGRSVGDGGRGGAWGARGRKS
jgi:ATP-dependent RNA helicase MSS116, mitochondrial